MDRDSRPTRNTSGWTGSLVIPFPPGDNSFPRLCFDAPPLKIRRIKSIGLDRHAVIYDRLASVNCRSLLVERRFLDSHVKSRSLANISIISNRGMEGTSSNF